MKTPCKIALKIANTEAWPRSVPNILLGGKGSPKVFASMISYDFHIHR